MDSAADCSRRSEEEDGKRDTVVNLEPRSLLDGIKGESIGETSPNGELEKGGSTPLPKAGASKGKGLRKWRRIRREPAKEGSSAADPDRKLKRGLSASEATKPPENDDAEAESSVASAGPFRSLELPVLDPSLQILVTETGFSLGYDSENSDDRTSKASTAASGPRQRFELAFGRDRSKGKAHGGRGRGRSGGVDSGKKSRGDRLSVQGREVSRSSVESDVRSSVAQIGSVSSNGGQSKGSVNFDGEHALQDVAGGISEQVSYKENGESADGPSHENKEVRREENESFHSSNDDNPFVESISLLQAAQEALEREVQKFEEIENVICSEENEMACSLDPLLNFHQRDTTNQSGLRETSVDETSEPEDLDANVTMGANPLPRKGSEDRILHHLRKKLNEMELELEDTLRSKLELDIECVTLRGTFLEDQLTLSGKQKSLAADCEKLTARLKETECRALALEAQAQELQASCQRLAGLDDVMTLKNRALRLLVQLVMLAVALWWFILHLIPPSSSEHVPT